MKGLRKIGNISGVVHDKTISGEQMKKLFWQRRALTATDDDLDKDNRIKTSQRLQKKKNSSRNWVFWAAPESTRPAAKNHQDHQWGFGDSEDIFNAKIFSAADSETGQQSHFQLEMPKLSQQGNAKIVIVMNNFDTASVPKNDQNFPQYISLQLQCASAQLLAELLRAKGARTKSHALENLWF